MRYSLNKLYSVAGISKQGVLKQEKAEEIFREKLSRLVLDADILRSEHPGCGVEKMYYTLAPDFLGRDKFVEIFMGIGYRVKRNKNYKRTTIPLHYQYPNMIEGRIVNAINQVWQSDITYYRIGDKFYYLTFILDVYSRRIVGYEVSENLRAEANLKALMMAMTQRRGLSLEGLVHHSDRGSQYGDKRYLDLLDKNGIMVSMGTKAQDNAYAERLNGIIKNEYLRYKSIKTIKELRKEAKKAVGHYNRKRLHMSIQLSPVDFEKNMEEIKNEKTPKMVIYSKGNHNLKFPYGQLEIMEEKYSVCPICIN